VVNLISAAHSYGMLAFNYNLYGGAFDNYWSDGSGAQLSMGIFSTPEPSGDPKAWVAANFNPRDYETKTTIDWSKWVPRQD
jgi:hypothetical protein